MNDSQLLRHFIRNTIIEGAFRREYGVTGGDVPSLGKWTGKIFNFLFDRHSDVDKITFEWFKRQIKYGADFEKDTIEKIRDFARSHYKQILKDFKDDEKEAKNELFDILDYRYGMTRRRRNN